MPVSVAYILKMFPRLSETFVLNEILELERQGVNVRIFALRASDDRRSHAETASVRATVTTVPRRRSLLARELRRDHLALLRAHPSRYLRELMRALVVPGSHRLDRFEQSVFVAACLERESIPHVHAHFASLPTDVALAVHRLTGLGFSFTAHAKDIYIGEVRPRDLAAKLRAARFAVTVSDYNARYLREIEPAATVVRVYNGVDLERFAPASRSSRDGQAPMVLAVGRLVEKKGFADLVVACARLRDDGCVFRCVIVGGGPEEDRLRAAVEAHDLQDVVTLTGPLTREAVLRLYADASVVVAPCVVAADGNRDGLPTVLTEAMALGVPVVATDVTGIPEIVRDGETGLVVRQRDPDRLAGAIADVLIDPDGARRRAVAGRALTERAFDQRTNVTELRRRFEAFA